MTQYFICCHKLATENVHGCLSLSRCFVCLENWNTSKALCFGGSACKWAGKHSDEAFSPFPFKSRCKLFTLIKGIVLRSLNKALSMQYPSKQPCSSICQFCCQFRLVESPRHASSKSWYVQPTVCWRSKRGGSLSCFYFRAESLCCWTCNGFASPVVFKFHPQGYFFFLTKVSHWCCSLKRELIHVILERVCVCVF